MTAAPAPPAPPTISVVVPTLNDGPDLEATLALIAASHITPEIIVVDDGSREPVGPRCRFVERHCPLRIIRNEARAGSGPAKSAGAAAAGGDIVVVVDSHIRPPWQWLDLIAEGVRRWPHSVLCPWSTGFDLPRDFQGRGARFVPHEHGYWDLTWNEPALVPADAANGAVIGCVLGGCYALGRSLLTRLGGYAPGYRGWGAEEEFLSLRAWIAGGDCRLLAFPVEHQYRRPKVDRTDAAASAVPEWELWFNRHLWSASVWEEGRYEKVYGPLMWGHYDRPGLREAVAAARPDIASLRAHLAAIRVRSDQDVGFALGFPHAETAEQYRGFWKHYRRRG